jgi:hypothetical protein
LQNGEGISAGNYFSTDKFIDRVHVSVDWPGVLGPPWTDGDADKGGPGHGGALTGARPPTAPLRQSSPEGAQKGERSTGSSARASPELGRRCGGRATVVQNREAAALGEDTTQAWRKRKRSGGRCGATRGWCSPFIGAGGHRGGVAGAVNAGVNDFNAIEDGGGFKREIKGGEMKVRW